MRIGIIGHGALGMMYASYLSRVPGVDLFFIADGERLTRLREEQLLVNGRPLEVGLERAGEAAAAADLLIVAVKYHHLARALEDAASHVGEETVLLSVMNGIDSEQLLAERFGDEHLLYTVALGMDAVREGRELHFTTAGSVLIGRALNRGEPDPELQRVQQLFSEAGLSWDTPYDMLRSLWWKFMINIGVNQVTAVLQEPYRVLQQSGEARNLMTEAMAEVIDCAAEEGVQLSHADIEHWFPILDTLSPEGKTSMHQDVEAGRKTEVEMFAGTLLKIAEKHGLPVPVNRSLYRLLKAKEAMYERS